MHSKLARGNILEDFVLGRYTPLYISPSVSNKGLQSINIACGLIASTETFCEPWLSANCPQCSHMLNFLPKKPPPAFESRT